MWPGFFPWHGGRGHAGLGLQRDPDLGWSCSSPPRLNLIGRHPQGFSVGLCLGRPVFNIPGRHQMGGQGAIRVFFNPGQATPASYGGGLPLMCVLWGGTRGRPACALGLPCHWILGVGFVHCGGLGGGCLGPGFAGFSSPGRVGAGPPFVPCGRLGPHFHAVAPAPPSCRGSPFFVGIAYEFGKAVSRVDVPPGRIEGGRFGFRGRWRRAASFYECP